METYKEYTIKNVGDVVTIKGWVNKIRNLGGLIFIDLRNRMGVLQIVVKPDTKIYNLASLLKSEYVIEVTGIIVERENKNNRIKSGDIEIEASDLVLINKSKDIPFAISDDTTALEVTRLKYRYLDLRRNKLQNIIKLRSKITYSVREFLNKLDFIEIETPVLSRSTPEGARDYLVPSRINKGSF